MAEFLSFFFFDFCSFVVLFMRLPCAYLFVLVTVYLRALGQLKKAPIDAMGLKKQIHGDFYYYFVYGDSVLCRMT